MGLANSRHLSRTLSKETYYRGKRDLICADFANSRHLSETISRVMSGSTRSNVRTSKETYYRGKRDLSETISRVMSGSTRFNTSRSCA
jgi:hypothetical protein